MPTLDTLIAIPDWQVHVDAIGRLIGTTFRNRRLLTKHELMAALDKPQQQVVECFYGTTPSDFGLTQSFYGIDEPPAGHNFHILKRQLPDLNGNPVLDIQYVPEPAYGGFCAMRAAFAAEIGERGLKISSAYRSPAFQVLIICYKLRRNDFNIKETLTMTALPGFSEHGLITGGALDLQFDAQRYVREDVVSAYASSEEFAWLRDNAPSFGFELSYPENNELGLQFEPWHWRFNN